MLCGPSRLERAEHRALAEREAVLGPHAPEDLAERRRAARPPAHRCSQSVPVYTGKLYRLPVYFGRGLRRYKWIALSNATLAVLLATLDASITLIAMPDIFRGIHLDPLRPENSFYLLWMILGYLVVTSVLIVSLGRLGDMYGRVKIYNLGFVIYTVASLFLAIDWFTGEAGATYLIVLADRAGRRRRLPAGQRGRDHHRRVPRQPARDGARDQQHRRRQRDVRRARAGRHPGADRLAAGLPDQRAGRPVRHRLGLPEARGALEPPQARADRLVGQPHVRARADPRDGLGDLRHPARTATARWAGRARG